MGAHARATIMVLFASVGSAAGQPVFSVGPGGPSGLGSDLIFTPTSGGPAGVGGGPGMGLSDKDDIDGISDDDDDGDWVPCYSVDSMSTGTPGTLRGPLPGFNVFHQSLRNQAAGDIFIGTEAYDRALGELPPPISLGVFQNELVVNQSPLYPNDLGLLPVISPPDAAPPGTPLDETNAETVLDPSAPPALFLSLSATSPSIVSLGGTSGADVFFDNDVTTPGGEAVYAQAVDLGLLPGDDINGLVVFDDDDDQVYSGTDSVFFTLAPGSPTLGLLGASSADVLVSTGGVIGPFAFHPNLGLLPGDNIDALAFDPLIEDSVLETIRNKNCPGDLNKDDSVSVGDFFFFVAAFALGDPTADVNRDGVVDVLDFFVFLAAFAKGCP